MRQNGFWKRLGHFGLVCFCLAGATVAQAGSPWLGVVLKPSPLGGAEIADVYPGSPMQAARVAAGDAVIAVNKKPVARPADVTQAVRNFGVGQHVTLTIRCADGQRREVTARLGERPGEETLNAQAEEMELAHQQQLVGQKAPKFTFETLHTPKGVALPVGKKHATVLSFFASYCGPCLREIPLLSKWQAKRPDVLVLALSIEDHETIQNIVQRFSPGYTVGKDTDRQAYDAFFVGSYPTTFLIDENGLVRAVDHGLPVSVEAALGKIPKSKP